MWRRRLLCVYFQESGAELKVSFFAVVRAMGRCVESSGGEVSEGGKDCEFSPPVGLVIKVLNDTFVVFLRSVDSTAGALKW